MTQDAPRPAEANLQQLRHDLLNPIHVLLGATNALLDGDLTPVQRSWVQALRSTGQRLLDIAEHLDSYRNRAWNDGQARLADLCSIAAARLAKPFDRERLVAAVEEVAGRRPLRILLVDDSPELAQLVRSFISGLPWDLEVVLDGEQAVAQATTERFDVVLMDIDLPGLDGTTAAHAIRAADLARGASPTPIVAMTAFDRGIEK